jgi:hypothetical protein
MPLDASDKIRKIQEIKVTQGYAIGKQTTQPGVNVSTCAGFYAYSTIRNFTEYSLRQKTEDGLQYFSTCQGNQ